MSDVWASRALPPWNGDCSSCGAPYGWGARGFSRRGAHDGAPAGPRSLTGSEVWRHGVDNGIVKTQFADGGCGTELLADLLHGGAVSS